MRKILITIILGIALLVRGGIAFAAETKEVITIYPGKSLSANQERVISKLAAKVLMNIAKARDYIRQKNVNAAKIELEEAHHLIRMIKEDTPTTRIKEQLWVAANKLEYQDIESVKPNLIPIEMSVADVEVLVPTGKAREHINKAKEHMNAGRKEEAQKELKLAADSLVTEEVDLPIASAERMVAAGQHYLAAERLDEADKCLKEGEDATIFLSTVEFDPVVMAKSSLWNAMKAYDANHYNQAVMELENASAYLDQAAQYADQDTTITIKELKRNVQDVTQWVKNGEKNRSTEFKSLTSKAEGLVRKILARFKK
jgi:cellobiose-specific phosphotransferase system component IIA